jgi:thioesterase domain-containing protein/acyl carrier protein
VQRAAQPHASAGELRALVEQALLSERELVVAPEWFAEWAAERSVGVDIRLKAARTHNELTRHRYEVVLHKDPAGVVDLAGVPAVSWGRQVSDLAGLDGCVDRAGGPVRVRGIPNARLVEEAAAASSAGVVGLSGLPGRPVDPADVVVWAREQGREAVLTWSGEAVHGFDVVVLPERQAVRGVFVSSGVGRVRANVPALSVAIGPLLAELPEYLRGRLPDYMVPAAVVPLTEFPLTANGKLDRQALPAEHTTIASSGEPRNAHEAKLCSLFCALLGLERVGIEDDFFKLGGHSLLATRLSASIRKEFGVDMPVRTIVRCPTVAELAALLLGTTIPDDHVDSYAVVLPLNKEPDTGKPPVWFLHGGGGLGWAYFTFAHSLDRPAYALQARGADGKAPLAASIEEMVEDYLDQILQIQPEGPYHLVGHSFGGPLAHALADALDRRGHEVALLAILDSMPAHPETLRQWTLKGRSVYREEIEEVYGRYMNTENLDHFLASISAVGDNNTTIIADFESPVYRGDMLFFNATQEKPDGSWAPIWRPYVLGSIEEHDVEATHYDLQMPEPAGKIMEVIVRRLAQ